MPRHPLDQYETPPHYVAALLAAIGPVKGLVYDPCAGTGCIARPLAKSALVFTNDIDSACVVDTHHDAAADGEAWGVLGYDWIISNPPFSEELAIARQAVHWGRQVALLARLSFLEPTEDREAFWQEHPPTGLIVLPRYSFRCNDAGKRATDSVTCCWVIWIDGQPPCLTVARRA